MSNHRITTEWLVPNLFAEKTVNLIAGTSRVGKSALILTMLNQYVGGEGMLDYAPGEIPPRRLGVLVLDRFPKYLRGKITAMECENLTTSREFPMTYLTPEVMQMARDFDDRLPSDKEPSTISILRAAKECLLGPPQLLLVESLDGLIPSGPINQHAIRKFLFDCQAFCETWDCTIIGTCGAVKQKFGEYYTSPMDVIAGHSTWGSGCSTAIILNYSESASHSVSANRRLFISAPDTEDRYAYLRFDSRGRLELATRDVSDVIPDTRAKLTQLLEAEKPGAEFQRDDFLGWGRDLDISQRSVDRWISESLELGMLEKHGRTVKLRYHKPNPS